MRGRVAPPVPPARPSAQALRREVYRKAIHIASIALPLFVWLVPRSLALALLVPTALLALVIDWTRLRFRGPRYLFLRRTRTLLRVRERRGFAGATYMAVAYALALLLFPTPIAVAAMLYNGLGDAAAALVGRRWGRHRIWRGKSLEGAAAALAVTLLIGLVIPGVPVAGALTGALAATLLELADLPPDDNLWVTLGGGLGAWGGALLLSTV
ncbi:phosphatidate cytidylyltransferase [soil metagenome]